MDKQRNRYCICGQVTETKTNKGIGGLVVEALDKDLLFDDFLGSALTEKDGRFSIVYQPSNFNEFLLDSRPDIYLRVLDSSGRVLHTTERQIRYNAGRSETLHIRIAREIIAQADVIRKP